MNIQEALKQATVEQLVREISCRNASFKSQTDGDIFWRNIKGEYHRTDGPAVEWCDGGKQWWVNGQTHRTDGPAIECSSGGKYWFVNGLRHRTDGPAAMDYDGTREWFVNGLRHRTDGPAVECSNGIREWWVEGKQLTQEEYINLHVSKLNS